MRATGPDGERLLCPRVRFACIAQYAKAVDFGALEEAGGKVISCVFKDDGRVLSVFAKRARGLFARHVVLSQARGITDLEAFSAEGYRLDRSQCGDGLLVFTRSKAQRVPPQPNAVASAPRSKKRAAPAPEPKKKTLPAGTVSKRHQPAEKRNSKGKAKRR